MAKKTPADGDRRADGSPEVIRLQERQKSQERDIQELRDTVFGNGKDGLKTKTSALVEKESVRASWDNRIIILVSILVLKVGYDFFTSVFERL